MAKKNFLLEKIFISFLNKNKSSINTLDLH